MPRARRHSTIGAPGDDGWEVVSYPDRLSRWPAVDRVAEALGGLDAIVGR